MKNLSMFLTGKTTFLNDVHKHHDCTYIRQYHNLRPYITVSSIPAFDPTQLPYWDIYIREKKDESIIVGGTIGGTFMPGLSGGQRKLLLFELISQRTASKKDLLIVLDEPFAGVTDDFVPFITKRLNEMRQKHNILLVTNDHVDLLTTMADNSVVVSAIDRTKVKVNDIEGIGRELALKAMSVGDDYSYNNVGKQDLKFFLNVELSKHGGKKHQDAFVYFNYSPGSEPLIIIASSLVAFFIGNPYIFTMVDWRNYMIEEADALLHSSKTMNKALKLGLALIVQLFISSVQYGVIQAVMVGDSLTSAYIFFGLTFDFSALLLPTVLFGLFTRLPFETVILIGSLPGLLMIFFSTGFSPGAGIDGLKAVRYLFPRFYLFCMIPGYELLLEGCPESNADALTYLILTSLIVPVMFVCYAAAQAMKTKLRKAKEMESRSELVNSKEFAELQSLLYEKKREHIDKMEDGTAVLDAEEKEESNM
eukprot:scaffold24854_cov78-Skeletonema_dohrnii-CCMP3373.AAC.1